MGFGSPQVFDERVILLFLHNTFDFDVRQRSQKLIFNQILDAYPSISFINEGLSIIQKNACTMRHIKFIKSN